MKKTATIVRNRPCELTGLSRTDKILKDISKNEGRYFLEQTNYTDTITDQNGNKIIVSPNFTANNTFIASKKIVSDYEKSGIYLENIPQSVIKYYNFNYKEFFYERAILIDINAAYPTALKNTGIITEETFNFLMRLKKIQRLKSIGMLASIKTVYEFEKTELISTRKTDKKEFADIYFYASYEIGEILQKCSVLNKNDFLFYWFDGIYIKPNWIYATKIMELLKENNYEFSVSWIENFQAKELKNTFKITWTEITNSENNLTEKKTKSLFLPKIKNL
jgi:hypothetical protein